MAAELITLRAKNPQLWVTLRSAEDVYENGKRRTIDFGEKVKFVAGRAEVTPAQMTALESHPDFERRFWRDDDLRAPLIAASGVQVVSGQATVRSRNTTRPPFSDWDTRSAREIKELLDNGSIADPMAALTWEASHKGRIQVVMALTKFTAQQADPGDDDDPVEDPEPLAAEGFVQPVPSGARGL